MQQMRALHINKDTFMFCGFSRAKVVFLRSLILAHLAFIVECLPAGAREINKLAANANCDIVSIRQAQKQQADGLEDKVDWYAFDRKHREYTGKKLLPEHEKKEPERDVVTGCAIRNEGAVASDLVSEEIEAEIEQMELVGWAARAAAAQEAEEEDVEDQTMHAQTKSDEPKKSTIDVIVNESSLLIQVAAVLALTAITIAFAFALRIAFKVFIGLLQRRRVCHIPCSLLAQGREIRGHMSVIGLRTFRFVPQDNDEMAYFKRTLDEHSMHFFTAAVADMSFEVFVDGIRSYYSPVAFDEKLTPKQQKDILAYSTIAPQIGELIIVPYDVKRHKKHKKNRAKLDTGSVAAAGDMA